MVSVKGVAIPVPLFQRDAGLDGYREQSATFAAAPTGNGYVNMHAPQGELCRAYTGQDANVATNVITKYISLRYMMRGQCNDFWIKNIN